jgi:hypothetical protein
MDDLGMQFSSFFITGGRNLPIIHVVAYVLRVLLQ